MWKLGRTWLLVLLAGAAGLLFSVELLLHARAVNGYDGFPLDDPWIHLTFARTLHDHHTFAYFPGDPSTQGSTSPLYTLLLALGFGVVHDEKVLSYALGLLFHALFLATLAAWARVRLGSAAWAAAAVLVVGLHVSVGILSVAGMETSLFLFLVAAAFLARATGRATLCGTALGLAVWVRPDGLILVAVVALDALLEWVSSRRRGHRDEAAKLLERPPLRAALPLVLLVACYCGFNLAVGHVLLPNTFAAKIAYYRMNPRLMFLRLDVAPVFLRAGWILLLPFVLLVLFRESASLFRFGSGRAPRGRGDAKTAPAIAPEGTSMRLEAGWLVALPLAYLLLLPYAHRFGRYLVPALPAYAILGLAGLRDVATSLARRGAGAARRAAPLAPGAIVLAVLVLQVRGARAAADGYAALCAYHHVRHERTGHWLAAHTPPDAVIATHDVGAIAYYSGRRIVDVVGVIDPEAARHLWAPGYVDYLTELFARRHVTHLAVLREWLGVDDVAPLFTADPRPEILEVYPWIPGRTHLLPHDANELALQGEQALREGNTQRALSFLDSAARADDRSARIWILSGLALEKARRSAEAETCYRRALTFFSESDEARYRLASVLSDQGKTDAARSELQALLVRSPNHAGARELSRRLGEK